MVVHRLGIKCSSPGTIGIGRDGRAEPPRGKRVTESPKGERVMMSGAFSANIISQGMRRGLLGATPEIHACGGVGSASMGVKGGSADGRR